MPSGPLADAAAVLMVGVALFCGGRMVLAALWHRPASHDVDLVHVVMGVSMAGMLTGWLAGRWTDVWLVVFSLTTAWFAWRAVRELTDGTATRPGCGHLPHLVGSAAMLYMLLAMQWAGGSGSGSSMAGMSATAGSLTLPLVVSMLLVLNALLSAGQAFLGPDLVPSPAGAAGAASSPGSPVGTARGVPATELRGTGCGREPRWHAVRGRGQRGGLRPSGTLLAPRCAAVCLVAMSVAMAYMFLTMRP